jgi:DNA-directed RNA polymerase subunit RPC12/RpoP
MSKFQHHSYFPKDKAVQSYLFPNLCFVCRKSFKKPRSEEARVCPECGRKLVEVGRKFSAPKSTDKPQWKKVQFLVEHGFIFQSVYEQREDKGYYKVSYPKTLKEAQEFVIKYKEQAVKFPLNNSLQRTSR